MKMDWFSGPIEQAISEVKSRESILIVFVKSTDEKSLALEPLFDAEDIVKLCSSYVCLKLVASSTEAAQFSAIYAVLSVPSVYLISCDGKPLEIIMGDITKDDLLNKIKNTLIKHNSNQKIPPETSGQQAGPSNETNENLEQKLAKAQSLLQAKRAAELQEAREKETQKVLEQRELGKKMQEFKEKKREKEQEELAAEIRRRRVEEKEARERIKRQIEEDRREKQQRYDTDKYEERAKIEEVLAEKRRKQSPPRTSMPAGVTRIQFRFSDGQHMTHQFQSTTQLNVVRDYLIESAPEGALGRASQPKFILAQIYPKRTFIDTDYGKSLDELGLSPASAIMVLPQTGRPTFHDSGTQDNSAVILFNSVMNFFLWPFYFFWNLLVSRFSSNSQSTGASSTPATAVNNTRRTKNLPKGSTVKREGNTTRLQDLRDDEDDNATWNGNSTQQM